MNLYKCKDHGQFLVRVKFKKDTDETLIANRLVYAANDDMISFYKEKSNNARRRGRTHKIKIKRQR